jgi:pimeloyl-[acyl-carrier protein] methyl ester esterase
MRPKNIIFVHGWASGPYVWLHQVSHFKNKHKVTAPRITDYDSIKEFILRQDSGEICLVGWSLGGMVSLKLASELKGKVKSLVLISSTPRFISSEDFACAIPSQVVEKIYNRIKIDLAGTLDWFYKFCFNAHERSHNSFAEISKVAGDFIEPINQDTLLEGLEFLMNTDLRPVLKDIDIPVLVIHGDQDRVCPPAVARFLVENIKNAKMHIIENTGHAPFLTQPDRVNHLIEEFIA